MMWNQMSNLYNVDRDVLQWRMAMHWGKGGVGQNLVLYIGAIIKEIPKENQHGEYNITRPM